MADGEITEMQYAEYNEPVALVSWPPDGEPMLNPPTQGAVEQGHLLGEGAILKRALSVRRLFASRSARARRMLQTTTGLKVSHPLSALLVLPSTAPSPAPFAKTVSRAAAPAAVAPESIPSEAATPFPTYALSNGSRHAHATAPGTLVGPQMNGGAPGMQLPV
ncbi:unnamed protein product [Peniophora sp. CBMAI 1063]|nr:unnamed protein product [Peniophora sp. CBMAI 1063]